MGNELKVNIEKAYSNAAADYSDSFFHELKGKPLDRHLLKRFARLISPGGIVCDLGCGPGQIACFLKEQGVSVMGIDLSEGMICEARRLNPSIPYEVGDMFHLSYPDDYFAGISAFYAIVNIPPEEISLVFAEMARVLLPGGRFFISFHTGNEKFHVEDFFEKGNALDFFFFDEAFVMDEMKKQGFVIDEALVRYPYGDEHSTKRAYILASKGIRG